MEIDLAVKQLIANLLREGLGEYLISKNFKLLILEWGQDEYWNRIMSKYRSIYSYGSSDEEKAIIDFLISYYNTKYSALEALYGNQFNSIKLFLKALILDFILWSKKNIYIQKLKLNLVNLDFGLNEIQELDNYAISVGKKRENEKLINQEDISKKVGIFKAGHNYDA